MSLITVDQIRQQLSQINDPDTGRDVVSSGLVSGIVVRDGGKVGFMFTVSPADKDKKAGLCTACENAVRALPGVTAVTAVLTAHNDTPIPPKPEAGYTEERKRATWNLTPVEHVKRIIAVASGKGGVGKSTTTVNLALAAARAGLRTGVLDADIYGPSLPRMLGVSGQPEIIEGKMQPLAAHGIAGMSMGFVTGEEAAILRGPMISKTLHQLLRMTRWGTQAAPLDLLLVDMPPGTGDIHLSMAQQVPLSGAIIVTTPQEVATIDAQKCLTMFLKLNVPVLGVVENMSYFTDGNGHRVAIFGEGGGKKLAAQNDVPFLGELPIDVAIREAADKGVAYDGLLAGAYANIIAQLRG